MTTQTQNTIVYFLGNTMYINVTNMCTNKCVFCVRDLNDTVGGVNLWIKENRISAKQIIEEIKQNSPETRDEIVFCGYGEPLIKLEVVKEVAHFIKSSYQGIPVRINTNGHANLIHKRNVVPELVGLIDKLSVSLNAENAELYGKISKCSFENTEAFEGIKKFIYESQKHGIDTTATVVNGFRDYIIDIEKCKEITESLGAKFKVREWLSSGYN